MTSASVKDLRSLVTFVGTSAADASKQNKGNADFGTLMAKTGDTDSEKNIGTSPNVKSKMEVKDAKADLSAKRRADVKSNTSKAETSNVNPEDVEQMTQSANEVLKEVAKELDVSEEEVMDAMETLGLDLLSLLDKSNLTDLVLLITGEEPMAMVTNEELFNSVKNLNSIVDAAIADLADDMDIELSDVISKVEQAEVQLSNTPEMQMSVETNSDLNEVKEMPKVTVTIHTETKDVKASTDEKGNVISTQSVENKDEVTNPGRVASKNENGQDRSKENENENQNGSSLFGQSNNLLNGLANNTHEVVKNELPQQSFFSVETQDIMNQIMDNIKVDIKPDVQELEMQLHPESLGTVKINLINKAGEITADFKVSSENVKEAVEAQLVELRQALRESGVKVEAVNVSVDTSGFDSNLWQGKENSDNFEQDDKNKKPHKINLNKLDALFEDEASEEEILTAQMMEANGNTVDFQA